MYAVCETVCIYIGLSKEKLTGDDGPPKAFGDALFFCARRSAKWIGSCDINSSGRGSGNEWIIK